MIYTGPNRPNLGARSCDQPRLSGVESSVVATEQASQDLADLSDCARRLNRPQQADTFLLLAWLAFDSATRREEDIDLPVRGQL